MRTILATLALASLLAPLESLAEDANARKQVLSLASLGRYGEALEKAKGSDDPICKFYLAQLLREDTVESRSRGVTTFDPVRAAQLVDEVMPYLKANADKSSECAYTLGKAYSMGLGVKPDNDLAFNWYMRSAKKGYPAAMARLGNCYSGGLGVTKNLKQAIAWYKKASDAGYIFALVQLGDHYWTGTGVPEDWPKANLLYEKAAKAGSVDGMIRCAEMAEDRRDKALQNKDIKSSNTFAQTHMKWLTMAAASGDAQASFNQGTMFRLGFIGAYPSDPALGFAAFLKASESGNAAHLLMLASCYEKGWGCTSDSGKAEKLFRESLAAAKREKNEGAQGIAEKLLSAGSSQERAGILDEKLGWSIQPITMVRPPFADDLKEQVLPTKDAGARSLVLTDIVAKPSDSERYLEVQGRVKNASGESLDSLKIAITLEDRAGNLLETDDSYLKPDPLEPGEVGTFKLLVKAAERYDHLKVDFTAGSGKSIPWADKSGKDVHQ
ncbi:FxLYD domain-containing protein [Singulisphaera sp. PoT]|uniref:FxLYD domain-containing protein n=1 Tax=Singulisphaera sp. PoT TaxID=3411797 RepID=UPI003BF48026